MNSYLPRINNKNAPDIPGSIMAHIAILPARKMNQKASGVSAGVAIVIQNAIAAPISIDIITPGVHFFISLNTKIDEIIIRPKKNDHREIASFSSKYLINLARDSKLVNIPRKRGKRKLPFTFNQKSLSLKLNNNLRASVSTDFIESRSSV